MLLLFFLLAASRTAVDNSVMIEIYLCIAVQKLSAHFLHRSPLPAHSAIEYLIVTSARQCLD